MLNDKKITNGEQEWAHITPSRIEQASADKNSSVDMRFEVLDRTQFRYASVSAFMIA
jgi:hypothetical protein